MQQRRTAETKIDLKNKETLFEKKFKKGKTTTNIKKLKVIIY